MRRLKPLLAAGLAAAAFAFAASPDPQSHFGHPIGADRTVLDWEKVVSYFRKLESSSDRIRVREYGRSTEGRPMIVAIISAPDTVKDLERYRRIQERLADPRKTPEDQARGLIDQGKAVVMITCTIHSTEIASTHTAVEFAWRLLAEDNPKFRTILDNVIFLLVPSLNPDGLDLVTQWYRKTLGTPIEGTSPPELYHKYVGHDNNRDWYMFSQAETRATIRELHNAWYPHIVYDVHQMGTTAARIFVPPWIDPVEPNIDPLVIQMCNAFGMGMALDLTAAGKKGVVVNALYDFWTPARHYQAYHGGLRILSESASARLATPIDVPRGRLDRSSRGYSAGQASWNHVEPWEGGTWRLRDIIDYQSVAWESCLYQAALRRADLLRNFYTIGQRASARTSPYAFVVPAEQRDPGAAAKLLETLSFGMVEIERALGQFEAGGVTYPEGSHVIRMRQPYSSFAKTLLERQSYPDLRLYPGGPPRRPYDATAHTLPLLMGVEVHAAAEPFTARLEGAESFPLVPAGDGRLHAADTETWRAINRWWDWGGEVWRDMTTGDFYTRVPAGSVLRKVNRPRVAVYRSYIPVMDEGWTRWVLDQFGFRYSSVRNPEILAGALREKYDVLILPDQSPASIKEGYRKGSMPEEYTGGLGSAGAQALRRFAEDGGTLILLNDASGFAEQVGIQAANVLRELPNQEFYCPGSLLRVNLKEGHPLTYGLPREIAIWSGGSPAWNPQETGGAVAVARYVQSEVLASGWLLGEQHLAGRAALLDTPMGRGRVILFGMRPQYRAQSYQAFKLLFNALLYLED